MDVEKAWHRGYYSKVPDHEDRKLSLSEMHEELKVMDQQWQMAYDAVSDMAQKSYEGVEHHVKNYWTNQVRSWNVRKTNEQTMRKQNESSLAQAGTDAEWIGDKFDVPEDCEKM